jgi:uncharacterized membrane protein
MFANLSPLLLAHLVAACLAMPLGLYQMLARQGTPGHALAGRLYVPAMLVCNIGALASYRPDTKFLPFHILAFVSLYSLGSGMWALKKWLKARQPDDLTTHKIQMAYSWLGLMMAGFSQIFTNPRFGIMEGFEPVQFWAMVLGLNAVLYAIGSWWLFRVLLRRQLA